MIAKNPTRPETDESMCPCRTPLLVVHCGEGSNCHGHARNCACTCDGCSPAYPACDLTLQEWIADLVLKAAGAKARCATCPYRLGWPPKVAR